MEEENKNSKEGKRMAYWMIAIIIGLICMVLSLVVAFIGSGGWIWLAVIGGIVLLSILFSGGK